MTDDEKKIAHRGGQLIKIIQLAGSPGMDEIAIKLNCGLTWHEQRAAERWFQAFELARTKGTLFDQAAELNEVTR